MIKVLVYVEGTMDYIKFDKLTVIICTHVYNYMCEMCADDVYYIHRHNNSMYACVSYVYYVHIR